MKKDYGKRIIPRNTLEFEDFIYPYYEQGQYNVASNLLLRYWKRKGKSYYAELDITGGLICCGFNGNVQIDFHFLLSHYFLGFQDEFVRNHKEEFYAFWNDFFREKQLTFKDFLSAYYSRVDWFPPNEFSCVYFEKKQYLDAVPKELSHTKNWKYVIKRGEIREIVDTIIQHELSILLKEATFKFREQLGLRGYSGRWVQEQILLDEIKVTFSDLLVIGQGSPDWLNGQRFDVWLPEINAAIEYNGIQHYEPVDYFGGMEGYLQTVERDNAKRAKCNENNVSLLEVRENYKIKEVLTWVESIIQKRAAED